MSSTTTGLLLFVTGIPCGAYLAALHYIPKVDYWRRWAEQSRTEPEVTNILPTQAIPVKLKSVLESVGMALLVAVLWIPIKGFGLFKGDKDRYYD